MRWIPTIALFSLLAGAVSAETFRVRKTADTNDGVCARDCSLREAIVAANANPGPDLVLVPAGTYSLTLLGGNENSAASGDLDITDDVEIRGAGAGSTVIDGNGTDRVFHVIAGSFGDVRLAKMTIQGGSADSGGGIYSSSRLWLTSVVVTGNVAATAGGGIRAAPVLHLHHSTVSGNLAGTEGGGIYNFDEGFLVDSTISGNTAADGGGVWNGLDLTVTGSTVSGNDADLGGGIFNHEATLHVTNSTCSGNEATGQGGCLYTTDGDVTLSSSTFVGNTAVFQGSAIFHTQPSAMSTVTFANTILGGTGGTGACFSPDGLFATDGGNVESPGLTCGLGGDDQAGVASAGLSALQDNGGPTLTHLPLVGSAAVDGGLSANCTPPALDQRGAERPLACDSGAVERGAVAPIFADGFESGDDAVWSGNSEL